MVFWRWRVHSGLDVGICCFRGSELGRRAAVLTFLFLRLPEEFGLLVYLRFRQVPGMLCFTVLLTFENAWFLLPESRHYVGREVDRGEFKRSRMSFSIFWQLLEDWHRCQWRLASFQRSVFLRSP